MADIFVSYSRTDHAFVQSLTKALQEGGYSVWWDREIAAGAEFAQRIETELAAAKAVVVVWSEASVQSNWVKDEAARARDAGKLVPIRCAAVQPPIGFGQFNALDFSGWDEDPASPSFAALAKSIGEAVGKAPLAAKPMPWLRKLRRKLLKPLPLSLAAGLASLAVVSAVLDLGLGGRRASASSAVAVLPFANEGSPKDDYLSEGVSDELREQLLRVGGLQIKAPASSKAFRKLEAAEPKIAERLGVGRLIEGSVRKDQGRLRISVQIVDGRSGNQTWSRAYERPALDLVAVQQELASAVAAELTGRSAAANEVAPPPTLNLSAFDAMLLAGNYEHEVRDAQVVNEVDLGKSIDLYRAAVKLDPKSALGHSRLAGALLYAGDADGAQKEIETAIGIDPDLSEVQSTLGDFYNARVLPGVGKAYERALQLNPNNVDALAGYAHWEWSFSPDPLTSAGDLFKRAVEIDPMSLRRYAELGYFYGVTGQREAAIALTAEIASRFSEPLGYSTIGQVMEQTGDFDIAIAAVKRAIALAPQEEDFKAQLAELYAELGDFDAAARFEPEPGLGQLFWRREYPAMIDLAEELAIDRPEDGQVWYLLGFAYTAVGDFENAARALRISGVPERAGSESEVGNDVVAALTLAVALDGLGQSAEARKWAEWSEVTSDRFFKTHASQATWAANVSACALALLGKDDEAMVALAHVNDGPGLPRMPWLKDFRCFKRFAGDKRYLSVIAAADKRQAEMGARVAAIDEAPND